MGTLAYILLLIGVFLPFIGLLIFLIGAILFENGTCLKIGLYALLVSIICLIGSAIADSIYHKKTADGKEKIVKVVKTKKEPIIDTTIVIKNSVADTIYTYKFKN